MGNTPKEGPAWFLGYKEQVWGVFPWGCSRLILLYQGWQVRVKTRARSMYMYVASNFGGGTKRSVPTTFSCRGRCKRSGSIPVDRKRFPGSAGVISFRVFFKINILWQALATKYYCCVINKFKFIYLLIMFGVSWIKFFKNQSKKICKLYSWFCLCFHIILCKLIYILIIK